MECNILQKWDNDVVVDYSVCKVFAMQGWGLCLYP